ncbi:DUF4062 domain-containing protein [Homoserinimonas sp. A447]
MAGRREQVFVSSTYLDLRDERQSVIQALLIAGCIPAGMELFVAGNDEKWRLIQRVISECDYYVLVIGGKYGSIDPTTDLSYTEMEYEFAESIGMPIMAFLHGEPGLLKGDQLELETLRREKLDAFRRKVEAGRVVRYWTNPAELPGHVALSMMETREQYPAEGWVRAGQAMTPEQKTEIAELRALVAELTHEAESRSSKSFDDTSDLAQGEDIYRAQVKASGYKEDAVFADGSTAWDAPSFTWTSYISVTWNELLQAVGPTLLHEASEPELTRFFQTWLSQKWKENPEVHSKAMAKQKGALVVSSSVVEDVLVQFYALDVISRGVKKRTVSDKGKYWALTNLGQDQMMKLRAIRRN